VKKKKKRKKPGTVPLNFRLSDKHAGMLRKKADKFFRGSMSAFIRSAIEYYRPNRKA
jgi:hypothetical protein